MQILFCCTAFLLFLTNKFSPSPLPNVGISYIPKIESSSDGFPSNSSPFLWNLVFGSKVFVIVKNNLCCTTSPKFFSLHSGKAKLSVKTGLMPNDYSGVMEHLQTLRSLFFLCFFTARQSFWCCSVRVRFRTGFFGFQIFLSPIPLTRLEEAQLWSCAAFVRVAEL